jgi:hypothetical protein
MATFDGFIDSAKVWELVSPEGLCRFVRDSFCTVRGQQLAASGDILCTSAERLVIDVSDGITVRFRFVANPDIQFKCRNASLWKAVFGVL